MGCENWFVLSSSSLEERDDVPEWLTLFLASFRLLTADLCKANSHLFSKVNILKLNINEKDICRSHRIGEKTEYQIQQKLNTRSNKN